MSAAPGTGGQRDEPTVTRKRQEDRRAALRHGVQRRRVVRRPGGLTFPAAAVHRAPCTGAET